MKPPRGLTAEEIRQWREANRHTVKQPGAVDVEALDEASDATIIMPSPQPSPGGRGSTARVAAVKKNLSPLKQLSIREASRSFKPHAQVEAVLDLHGCSKLAAYGKVQEFILMAREAGKRHVAIITGKGRGGEVGVLRANLPHWLNEPQLRAQISAVAEAAPEKGGAGVMHVLIKSRES